MHQSAVITPWQYAGFLSLLYLLLTGFSCNNFFHKSTTKQFKLGETWVTIHLQQYGVDSDTAYLLLHHNETAAGRAAQAFLPKRNGRFIQINSGGKRRINFTAGGKTFAIDPNRIFTVTGARKEVKGDEAALAEVLSFARYLLHKLHNSKVVVALHNNTNGDFSLHTYLTGNLRADATDVYVAQGMDADNFVVTTDAGFFERCKTSGLNAVLQNDAATDDGSASVYFGQRGITYINIEAQHGNTAFTLQALQALFP